jgi:UDP-N-acetylmuramoyl-tripeptide--D-alanyl-D-alanine ligase
MADCALWTIEELVAATGGELVGEVSVPLQGVAIDSRAIQPGDVFVAIKGDRTDGHIYAASALKAGAGLAIVSRPDDEMRAAGALLVVPDALEALEQMGRAARNRVAGKIIAVTGSVGKTTTKDALKVALSACGAAHAAVSSFNNHWGVPLTLARMPRDTAYGVIEVGMNHAGEIETLIDMVKPHVAIITAIAESHIGHFESLTGIADAKAEIFTGVVPGGVAIINRDNEFHDYLADKARDCGITDVRGFGEAEDADIRLVRFTLHDNCSCMTADVCGEQVTCKLGAPGRHVVQNALAVLGACQAAGADLARCALALANITPPSGRGVRHTLVSDGVKITLIDESYNANPASVRAALDMLAASEPDGHGRRIAVLGDMLELGVHSAELHSGLLDPVEAADVDKVFVCGEHMRHLWAELPARRRGVHKATSAELIEPLLETIQSGDIIMVKGSLGSKMAVVVDAIKHKYGGEAAG